MTNDYDICIIKVTPPFTYGDSTRPVGLARSDAVPTEFGMVCGWGYYMVYTSLLLIEYNPNIMKVSNETSVVICAAILMQKNYFFYKICRK